MTDSARSPYPGLRSFQREESDLFFGREACTDQMVDKLVATRFLAVLGASGSGKSSLVRTGLLDALELGLASQAGVRWAVAVMRPGRQPLTNLAQALLELASTGEAKSSSRLDIDLLASFLRRGPRAVVEWCNDGHLPPGHNLLLLVDQFEELFRYRDYAEAEDAESFVALLLGGANAPDAPIYVVMTMRSEFLGTCSLFPGLAEQINAGLYLTPRMTRQEIREAIEGPASVCGFSIEPALVNRLLNDLAVFSPWEDERGADQTLVLSRRADQLPLMQHVLNRMWMQAEGKSDGAPVHVTLEEYERLGGLSGALDAHAQEAVESLSAEDGTSVGRIFRALTSGSAVGAATRRPCRLDELVAVLNGRRDSVLNVVNAFRARGCNFLTPPMEVTLEDDTIVDISHESLIRQWSALREWVREESQSAETYHHVAHLAQLRSQRETGLLRMPYLEVALTWRRREAPNAAWGARYGGDFGLTMRFLDASERSRARLRNLAIVAVSLLVLGSGAFGILQLRLARSVQSELMMAQKDRRQLDGELERAKTQLIGLNYAEELTDFGVPPQESLQPNYGTKTPISIPKGTVIFTKDLQATLGVSPTPIMIDTLSDEHDITIPGALRIPFGGLAGDWEDATQHRLAVRLDNLTNGDHARTLIFFCQGARCWESYNASLRAMKAGYTRVYWYRGGLASWQAFGFSTHTALRDTLVLSDSLTGSVSAPSKYRWMLAMTLGEAAERLHAQGGTNVDTAVNNEMLAYRELKTLTGVLPDNANLWSDFMAVGTQLWEDLVADKKLDAARSIAEEMKSMLGQAAAGARPQDDNARSILTEAFEHVAETFKRQQEAMGALRTYVAALQIWGAPDEIQPDRAAALKHVVRLHRSVGWLYDRQDKPQEALKEFLEAEAVDRRRVAAAAPDDASGKSDLWIDLFDAGYVLERLKRYDEAMTKLAEARSVVLDRRQALPDDIPLMVWTTFMDNQIGSVLLNEAKFVEAFKVLDENVALGKTILQKAPNNNEAKVKVRDSAQMLGNLSYQLVLKGEFADALQAADDALSVLPDQVWIQTNRAHALLFLDHPDEAREIYLKYRGQKTVGDKAWEDVLQDDFAELRQHGFNSPLFEEVATPRPALHPSN